ncbi:hypothetical protein GQ457_01G014240 [Hibiscus cannabinus]
MRIRNSRNHPQRPLSPPPSPPPPEQHVMVSRINARLSSVDDGSDSKDTIDSWSVSTHESFGHSLFGQTSTSSNSVSSSLSHTTGRWCEEEKAIPLKKRRVVIDALMEERKQKQRCDREKKKEWGCDKMRVKGRSLCPTIRNGGEGEGTRSFAASGNQMGGNKRVKARSISSLLRETVPLY